MWFNKHVILERERKQKKFLSNNGWNISRYKKLRDYARVHHYWVTQNQWYRENIGVAEEKHIRYRGTKLRMTSEPLLETTQVRGQGNNIL